MSFGRFLKKLGVTVVSLSMLGLQLAPAQAAMIGTEQLVQQEQSHVDRTQLLSMLEREDIQAQLIELGVDPNDANDRVAGMTDAQVAELNDRLADLPAGEGAGTVIGILLIIFLVFVITDVIGATNIFPFIHPVNK